MAKSVGGRFSYVTASTSVKKNSNGVTWPASSSTATASRAADGAVTLMRGSTVLKSTKADEDGHFAFTFKVTRTYKNYKVKWVRSGSTATNLYSKALTIKCVRWADADTAGCMTPACKTGAAADTSSAAAPPL